MSSCQGAARGGACQAGDRQSLRTERLSLDGTRMVVLHVRQLPSLSPAPGILDADGFPFWGDMFGVSDTPSARLPQPQRTALPSVWPCPRPSPDPRVQEAGRAAFFFPPRRVASTELLVFMSVNRVQAS